MSRTWQTCEEVARQLLSDVRAQSGFDDVEGRAPPPLWQRPAGRGKLAPWSSSM
jgi:hypothetical protein